MFMNRKGRINVIQVSLLPKAVYRLNEIPIKIPMAYFTEPEKNSKDLYGTTK